MTASALWEFALNGPGSGPCVRGKDRVDGSNASRLEDLVMGKQGRFFLVVFSFSVK